MKRLLLILTCLTAFAIVASSQTPIIYEDFEGGPKLNWNPFGDGTFNGAVDNPAIAIPEADPLGINPAGQVGSYTKEAGRAFSLLIAVLDQPMDLSVNNKFTIQVNAPVASAMIFKLEGTGEALEKRANIAVRDRWIEYTFDMSGAANFTTINKIIIFFDPGNQASSDTYLFDNIIAYPADACAGTVPDPQIIDDFECQRNATYGSPGYLDIKAVDNPDPSGINTSTRVGEYTDRQGAFHAMVIDYENPIDLTQRNIVKIKIWAPKTGRLLVKFEGGGSPPIERDAQVTEINKWVEYSINFSDQAGANHRKLVFFFNAGVDNADGDIYYIDDILLVPTPPKEPLEDFEPDPKLVWEPLALGTFNGAINNPDKSGINTSDRVGSFTKGASRFGGLSAFIGQIDLSAEPQFDLQVWAPQGATSFTMQLSSPSQGLKSIRRDITEVRTWVQLSFNFEEFESITDFESIRMLFDENLDAAGSIWYFDNLIQGGATVDPCEGTVPISTIVDDFDCQRNVVTTTSALKVINNPDPRGINPNPLNKVGEYTDPIGQPFAALVYNYGAAGVNLSTFNQLSVKIWSPKAVPMGFKLEGGSSPAVEIVQNVTRTGEWVEYVVDFSAQANANHQRLVFFFNFDVNNPDADVYYIDDIQWKRLPFTGCVVTFETPELTLNTWRYFANGSLENDPFQIIDNPDKSGVNTSDKIGVFREAPDGQSFAGMFADPVAPVQLGASRTMRMKVWSPVAQTFVMKLERAIAPAPNSGDILAQYTTPGVWQELTWDFSKTQGGADIPVGSQYQRITLIPNFGVVPTEVTVHYFDDITVGEGSCAGPTSIFEPVKVERLKVYPNPAYNELTVEGSEKVRLFVVFNAVGQRVAVIQPNGQSNLNITVNQLDKGMYVLAGYDEAGQLIANARFVKQ
ncbi:MAG TPA: T9SS type A sorting domain-containing protein [Saprospiraceae bacterium]|nr:T9SS type A sorting domain-containing protein [Saprospiraceae bacterium]